MTGSQETRITILDAMTANQIAAGEVVERPASVVKELVENSLDAAARHITVEIEGGGLQLIRVRDDGRGIEPEDAPLAFARHATSKIRRAADLARITTLGFRGEALASIAAVARVEMATRPPGRPGGTLVRVAGGKPPEVTETGCPPGTSVTVKDLFYNTPARRQYLKKPSTEARAIVATVERLALGHPGVAFSLSLDGRRSLATPGNGDLQAVLAALYGLEIGRELLPFNGSGAGWSLQGFTSPPWLHRSNRDQQVLLINGRYITNRLLTWAIESCYRNVIPAGRHPLFVLHLAVDPGEVDVNVHPAKLEVRLQREQDLARQVTNLVKGALFTPRAVAPVTISRSGDRKGAGSAPPVQQGFTFREPDKQARHWGEYVLRERARENREPEWPEKTGENTGAIRTREVPEGNGPVERDKPDPTGPEKTPAEETGKQVLPPLRALGQVFNTYILAGGEDGLYIIDQHAAHERCRYEALVKEGTTGSHPAQMLEPPLPLHLAPDMQVKLIDQIITLRELGFIIEEFGTGVFLLRSVPLGIPPGKEREVLEDFLAESTLPAPERLLKLIACHGAIKAGQSLAGAEMQKLLDDLRGVDHPYTCPHGRPAVVRLDEAQLARYFHRHLK
ncbi:DNA mismatch repair endonuclease MutL [Neomoorella thermoacetica]|uniref:DNA mismatch repair endonuclease MutL n=1 Tax=Neomoorella thermoacetica TaxID=1525 RepID=UPI0009084671|nr:DNA mismatch repair endonuclease MutL [Moorella thermoacetica]APC08254.1 DNA mismatch repair protein MutL [Moorella thermoacetica]